MQQESGWYPPGAELDPNAPYNEEDSKGPFNTKVLVTEVYERITDLSHNYKNDDLEEIYKYNEWTLEDLLYELRKYVMKDKSDPYFTSKILHALDEYESSNFSIVEC